MLVIGGGSTGVGVARDAAMRSFATVVERRDLADGTTGRYHGLLHSGGRYAVGSAVGRASASRRTGTSAVSRPTASRTAAASSSSPWDDPAYGDEFVTGCRESGIPSRSSTWPTCCGASGASAEISRAFAVPDGALDPWKLAWSCARSAVEHGATVYMTYHRVAGLELDDGRVVGATLHDERAERTSASRRRSS